MADTTHPLIAKALTARHTHEVVTVYADGRERRFTTRSHATAESFAERDRRKVGRDLIDPLTGNSVRVASVTVRAIAA